MGSVWSSDDSDEWEDSGEEWSISLLYSVVKGEAIGDDADYYSDGAWCDKCGDNAGLEADLYCVDCEAQDQFHCLVLVEATGFCKVLVGGLWPGPAVLVKFGGGKGVQSSWL